MNGEDAVLMSREQIIDKIADDRVRFVAELGYNPANECAATRVPIQIDRAVRIVRAVIFAQPCGRVGCLDQTLIKRNFFSSCGSLIILLRSDPRPVVIT
jgi:hypothetical protein